MLCMVAEWVQFDASMTRARQGTQWWKGQERLWGGRVVELEPLLAGCFLQHEQKIALTFRNTNT